MACGIGIGIGIGGIDSRQFAQMGHHAAPQRAEVVATFKARHDAAVRVALRHCHQLARDPGVIGFEQFELRQPIVPVRIEAG